MFVRTRNCRKFIILLFAQNTAMPEYSLQQIQQYCIQNQIPFASYRLPYTDEVVTVFQNIGKVTRLRDTRSIDQYKGFIFAPYEKSKKAPAYFFMANILVRGNTVGESDFLKIQQIQPENNLYLFADQEEISFSAYARQLAEIKQAINKKTISKAVLSRFINTKKIKLSDAVDGFFALEKEYDHAMVSLIFVPETGAWLGASPEVLLLKVNQKIQTYALAGTQKRDERELTEYVWGSKEVEEQEIVCRYIRKNLENNEILNYKETIPLNSFAANLVHLRSVFTFELPKTEKFQKLLADFHPTPAVCGMPKKEALEVIRNTEKYNRRYYSGFLGPVNIDNGTIALYVNLRCMNLLDDYSNIYVGGGITADSETEKEWDETIQKSKTLLNVLEKIKKKTKT